MEIMINQAITAHQEGRLEEAERLYRSILKKQPTNLDINNNLGVLLHNLRRLDEAEASYRKAIELKPDYVEAHSNLGVVLKDLNKFDEAEASYRKAIELKPDYEEALLNLDMLVRDKNLLDHIFKTKKSIKENKVSSADSDVGLTSNPFITHRNVETKLLKDLYKSELKELNKTKDARYGNGRCSDFKFLENDFPIIKTVREDLKEIMRSAVKSEIFIFDSFLNIYGPKSGSTPHDHLRSFDKNQKLINQKYSLTYYLDIGDQNCSEPGNLKLYDPPEEIELSKGTIVIIPAARKHGAIYDGKTDRIMIGINFYGLI
jgi:tetratricopeptide (TPR) repeat protein